MRHQPRLRVTVAEDVTGEGKEEEGPMLVETAVVVVMAEIQDLQIPNQLKIKANRQCRASLLLQRGIQISLVVEKGEEEEAALVAVVESGVEGQMEAGEVGLDPVEGEVGEEEVGRWVLVFLVAAAVKGLAEGGTSGSLR